MTTRMATELSNRPEKSSTSLDNFETTDQTVVKPQFESRDKRRRKRPLELQRIFVSVTVASLEVDALLSSRGYRIFKETVIPVCPFGKVLCLPWAVFVRL